MRMRILIVTDAWHPQVNGVVRTLSQTRACLLALGHEVGLITPQDFTSLPCPSYPEIRLAIPAPGRVGARIAAFAPDAVHLSTEGPLGWAARRHCLKRGLPFTTAYHTRFPEYVNARWRVPLSWSYGVMRRFHAPASNVMVATRSLQHDLESRGISHIARWSRGVDVEMFHPGPKDFLNAYPRPIHLYVGRVAVEKNIEAFLSLSLPGTKLVVGGGPQWETLRARYPEAVFVGQKTDEELARYYAAADVFVFPSLTDTFGLVLLEALASGLPVAAFPVTGPLEVIGESGAGALDLDLGQAITRALRCAPETCRARALEFSWQACTRQFLDNLRPVG